MNDSSIIIYSTTNCPYCKTEKQYLSKKGIAYIEKNIEEDEEARQELLAKINGNYVGVPVTDIAGTIILGFDRHKIDNVIVEKGLLPATV